MSLPCFLFTPFVWKPSFQAFVNIKHRLPAEAAASKPADFLWWFRLFVLLAPVFTTSAKLGSSSRHDGPAGTVATVIKELTAALLLPQTIQPNVSSGDKPLVEDVSSSPAQDALITSFVCPAFLTCRAPIRLSDSEQDNMPCDKDASLYIVW